MRHGRHGRHMRRVGAQLLLALHATAEAPPAVLHLAPPMAVPMAVPMPVPILPCPAMHVLGQDELAARLVASMPRLRLSAQGRVALGSKAPHIEEPVRACAAAPQ